MERVCARPGPLASPLPFAAGIFNIRAMPSASGHVGSNWNRGRGGRPAALQLAPGLAARTRALKSVTPRRRLRTALRQVHKSAPRLAGRCAGHGWPPRGRSTAARPADVCRVCGASRFGQTHLCPRNPPSPLLPSQKPARLHPAGNRHHVADSSPWVPTKLQLGGECSGHRYFCNRRPQSAPAVAPVISSSHRAGRTDTERALSSS